MEIIMENPSRCPKDAVKGAWVNGARITIFFTMTIRGHCYTITIFMYNNTLVFPHPSNSPDLASWISFSSPSEVQSWMVRFRGNSSKLSSYHWIKKGIHCFWGVQRWYCSLISQGHSLWGHKSMYNCRLVWFYCLYSENFWVASRTNSIIKCH